MQTDVGDELDAQTLIASYVYAARYDYSDTVLHNDNQIRVSPHEGEGQQPIREHLWTRPEGSGVEYRDRFGNRVRRVRIIQHHDTLVVATTGQVSLATRVPEPADCYIDQVRDLPEGIEYVMRSPLVNPETVAALAHNVAGGSLSLLPVIRMVTDWVFREITFRRGTTDVTTTAEQVVGAMEGVCQDKTHLALGMLRALGVPCRYASGLRLSLQRERVSEMDPRTVQLGTDRWLTDSRVYNLISLGRWIERAQTVARVLHWAARQAGGSDAAGPGLDKVLSMAASIRGVTVASDESALDVVLTRDSGASLRGCLAAARYNATHVAPIQVIQSIGAAIGTLDNRDSSPASPEEIADLMQGTLEILDGLHDVIEAAWLHSKPLSEEEVYKRLIQRQ